MQLAAAPLEELVEDGPEGLLPRIGPDGMRPMDAYARPVDPAASGSARIAIGGGGIGIAEAGTEDAITHLPGAVTLAFYVGVVNYFGARFTSDEAALAPVLAEIGRRGLLYLDDGMSRADRLAEGMTAFARADVVLDTVTEAEAIDERLAQVAAIAHKRGYAVATATAFPVTIERIIEFVRTAEERGIEMVPLTALVDAERT